MNEQMSLEEMFCRRFLKPDVDDFFSSIEMYRENFPKNCCELANLIDCLEIHLTNFKEMGNDLQGIVSAEKKHDPIRKQFEKYPNCERESSMKNQRVTVSTAFEIIIHHFSGNTVLRKKEEIDARVREAHEMQGDIPEFAENDPVNTVLYALKQFGLADNPEHGYWRIKSVDDMCDRLQALVHNRNIGDEGEDF